MLALALLGVLVAGAWPACRPHDVRAGGKTVTFFGVVRNATTAAPITGASVTIGGSSTITGSKGQYVLTLAAARTFQAVAIAPGYLAVSVDIAAGAVLSGRQHFDFAGAHGLNALGGLTAVLTGTVTDAQTGAPVGEATVSSPGAQAIADKTGHYQITLPGASRIQVQLTALGYQWRPPLTLSMPDHSVIKGQITLDFGGAAGLVSAFRTNTGDTLRRFSQVVPSATRALDFSGSTAQDLESSYAVTFPDGDADIRPITHRGGRYTGRLAVNRGTGIYQLEINAANGFALFNLPIYDGVPYTPPPPPPLYPPDDPKAAPAQLETQALQVLNGLRARYRRPPFVMTQALQRVARAHSVDVVTHDYYDQHPHTGSDGSDPVARLIAAHIAAAEVGEDVALDTSVRAAIDDLLLSPGHRANILLSTFDQVGIGVARRIDGNLVLTIDFVRPL